jgi:hypothetical protein
MQMKIMEENLLFINEVRKWMIFFSKAKIAKMLLYENHHP